MNVETITIDHITEEGITRERAMVFAAQEKIAAAAAELRRLEEISRAEANETAAAEHLEKTRARRRECEAVTTRLANELAEINRRLSAVLYLESTDDVAAMLTRRAAIELQLTSAHAERPGILKRFAESEAQYARARELRTVATESRGQGPQVQ